MSCEYRVTLKSEPKSNKFFCNASDRKPNPWTMRRCTPDNCKNKKSEIKAKDFLGNELKIGDEVVFMQVKYRGLKKGKIIKLTKCMATIEHERFNIGGTETIQCHSQMIKIPKG